PFLSLRPARHYPRLWIRRSSSERRRDFNPPDLGAAQRTLLRSLTSHVRSSSATAPRLPDAGQSGAPRLARRGISRFPSKELLHMPGSSTTPGRSDLAMVRPNRVAFRARNSVGTRGLAVAAQWLAYALPYRRFVGALTDANARLGADVDRYSFIVVDLHHLLLAGLPAHFEHHYPYELSGGMQQRV